MTIRSTYVLDVDSVRNLERLARQWGVPKSEALRRSIQAAASNGSDITEKLQALDELQGSIKLSKSEVKKWQRAVRAERRS